MMLLIDAIEISAPPEKVWGWLFRFAENYRSWHPDHIQAYWQQGEPNREGSVLYTEETLSGRTLKMVIKIEKFIDNRFIGFSTVGMLGFAVPGGAFEIEPTETGCRVKATLRFRAGNFLAKLAPKIFSSVKRHMEEEGRNLKKLIEASGR
jgi:hypothetical protein